jgi:hypothetical protein
MANSIRLTVKGFEEFERKLARMQDSHKLNNRMRSVLVECAQDIKSLAAANIRRLFKRKTGKLEQSMYASVGRTVNPSAYVKAAFRVAAHARLLEFGHRIVGPKPNKKDTGKLVVARPFFRPAVDALKPRIKKKIAEKIRIFLMES